MLQSEKRKYLVLLLPFALLILLFEMMPLANIFINSFLEPGTGGITLSNFTTIFTSDYYLMSIQNSLFVSVLSAFIGIAIALLGAYAIHTAGDKMKKFYITTLNMTSNFQGIVLAFCLHSVAGEFRDPDNIGGKMEPGWIEQLRFVYYIGDTHHLHLLPDSIGYLITLSFI